MLRLKHYWSKECLGAGLLILLIFTSIFTVQAMDEHEIDPLSREFEEWNEPDIDVNHFAVIQEMMDYIKQNINKDIFASLHIDREEKAIGIIVLSFTEELRDVDKHALEALAEESVEVRFRVVDYSERELLEKQAEVDSDLSRFEDLGITIYHTGVNVFINRVEIGISPFTEENANIIYQYFGDEKIYVVEGHEIQLLFAIELDEEASVNTAFISSEEDKKDLNFFQRFVKRVMDFFENLFKK